jgi:hypothetical protein
VGRSRLACVALVGLALLAAVACSGDEDDVAAAPATTRGTSAPTTTSPPVEAPVLPLTGEPVGDPAVAARPALVVKIDNVDTLSRPQAGINQADIVWEEKIEGQISRFAAIFHSTDADSVGPVRSGRSTDVAIVSSLNRPLYAFSGANAVFIVQLRAAPLVDIGYDVQPRSYDRRRDRKAPDNVFTSTQRLWALAPEGAGPPPPQLVHRDEDVAVDGRPVAGVDYSFGARMSAVTYRWDPVRAGWARTQAGTPHVDEAGVQVAPPNVIIQQVEYVDTGLVDTSGAPVPEARLVGEGEAWVLTDGLLVEGRWSKPDDATPTRYTTAAGEPIGLTPGPTWIALVPVGGDAVVVEAPAP